MAKIVGAGFLSHAPTIMLPKELRYKINGGKEITLVTGLQRLRTEVLDQLKPDIILVFDTHWFTTVEFIITAQERRQGLYTSEELPRGIRQVPYDLTGDPKFAHLVAEHVSNTGVRCSAIDDPYLPINYPTVNIAHYLNKGEKWLSVSTCQTADDDDFLRVGKGIRKAIDEFDGTIVLIASGGMSHTFWPLKELPDHEFSDPIHIITPEARAADEERIEHWLKGDHASVINNMDSYRQHKPEGKFGHYLMMVGALGAEQCKATGELYGEYENATGTGQVHVWFDQLDPVGASV